MPASDLQRGGGLVRRQAAPPHSILENAREVCLPPFLVVRIVDAPPPYRDYTYSTARGRLTRLDVLS